MKWNPENKPPPMRGHGATSAPVVVLLENGTVHPAEFWQSSAPNQPRKWYLSREIMGYPQPFTEFCEEVVGWCTIEEFNKYLNGILTQLELPLFD